MLGASCLSQWWPSPFTVDGVEYATAEHWMMAGKARLFEDAEAERQAIAAREPGGGEEGRPAGARLRRGRVGARAVRHRGRGQRPQVRPRTATCGRFCWARASGCWWRRARWTACGASAWPRTTRRRWTPQRWRGLNLLGFALMEARDAAAGGLALHWMRVQSAVGRQCCGKPKEDRSFPRGGTAHRGPLRPCRVRISRPRTPRCSGSRVRPGAAGAGAHPGRFAAHHTRPGSPPVPARNGPGLPRRSSGTGRAAARRLPAEQRARPSLPRRPALPARSAR